MNKVVNINLGGYAFTIDEEAYHHLSQYLTAIDQHFKSSEGFEDITSDIEIRMAELFQAKLKGRQVLNIKDIGEAINTMGTPEDFGATSNYTGVPEEEAPEETTKSSRARKHKFGKQLYRNSDDAAVGGVAAGVSAYFGIEDPIWVRLLFVLMVIGAGTGILLYIILWAVLPEAKTPKQKLEMKGERITVKNIAKTIEEELKHVSSKISEFGDELKSDSDGKKKGNGGQSHKVSYAIRTFIDRLIPFVRRVASFIETFIRRFLRPVISIIGTGMLVFLTVLWVGLMVGGAMGYPYLKFMFSGVQIPLVYTLIFIVLSLPIISLVLAVLRLFFNTRVWKSVRIGMLVAWIVSVTAAFSFVPFVVRDFDVAQKVEKTTAFPAVKGDVLMLAANQLESRNGIFHFGETKVVDNELLYGAVELRIEKSDGDVFELVESKNARGRSTKLANERAKSIKYKPVLEENTLTLDDFLTMKNEQWRGHHLALTLKIPVGKSVKISPNAVQLLHGFHLETKNGNYNHWQLGNATITAESDGLVCASCEGEPYNTGNNDNPTGFKGFSNLHLEGNLKVHIETGDDYEVRFERSQHGDLDSYQEENTLFIVGTSYEDNPTKVYITMPKLTKLEGRNVGDIWINNLNQALLEIDIDGQTEVHGQGLQVTLVKATLKDEAELTLKGSGNRIEATVADDAKLDADRFKVEDAFVTGTQDAYITLSVLDTLDGTIEEDVDLKYEGKPNVLLIK